MLTSEQDERLSDIHSDWRELSEIKSYYKDFVISPEFFKMHYMVTDYIIALKPKSIFEFGCAWGKNFTLLRKYIPNLQCTGFDLSEKSVKMAKEFGYDVTVADETHLKNIHRASFDVAFTSSVLNHLPPETAKQIVKELKRIAPIVVACECVDKSEFRWYKHPYEEWGFTDTGKRAWSPIIKAQYRLYVMRQKHF